MILIWPGIPVGCRSVPATSNVSIGVEKGLIHRAAENWMGVNNPAIDAMIDSMLAARDREDFVAAVRALDRVLTTGRFVIPAWYSDHSRIAHRKELKFPDTIPIYGDWIGFQPDVWWYEE